MVMQIEDLISPIIMEPFFSKSEKSYLDMAHKIFYENFIGIDHKIAKIYFFHNSFEYLLNAKKYILCHSRR